FYGADREAPGRAADAPVRGRDGGCEDRRRSPPVPGGDPPPLLEGAARARRRRAETLRARAAPDGAPDAGDEGPARSGRGDPFPDRPRPAPGQLRRAHRLGPNGAHPRPRIDRPAERPAVPTVLQRGPGGLAPVPPPRA